MASLACPFCYARIDGRALWFRCTGRGSPGKKGCEPGVDPDREREIGVQEHVLPSFGVKSRPLWASRSADCPHCGGTLTRLPGAHWVIGFRLAHADVLDGLPIAGAAVLTDPVLPEPLP